MFSHIQMPWAQYEAEEAERELNAQEREARLAAEKHAADDDCARLRRVLAAAGLKTNDYFDVNRTTGRYSNEPEIHISPRVLAKVLQMLGA